MSSEVVGKGKAAGNRCNISRIIERSIIASLLWGSCASSLLNRRTGCATPTCAPPPSGAAGTHHLSILRAARSPARCPPKLRPPLYQLPTRDPIDPEQTSFFPAPPRLANRQHAPAGYATAAAVTLTIIASLPVLPLRGHWCPVTCVLLCMAALTAQGRERDAWALQVTCRKGLVTPRWWRTHTVSWRRCPSPLARPWTQSPDTRVLVGDVWESMRP